LTVKELLQLAEKRVTPVLGGDPAVAADVDYALAVGLSWQGAAPQARTLLDRALHHAQKANDVARQAMVTARLGVISYESNQFDQAWKESLELCLFGKAAGRNLLRNKLSGAPRCRDQPVIYPSFGSDSPRVLREALAISRRHPNQVRPSSRAACLQKLGESYINVDRRYQDAYALLQEAIAINRSDPSRGDLLLTSLQSFGRANRYLGAMTRTKRRNGKPTN